MDFVLSSYFDIEASDEQREQHKSTLIGYFETQEEALFLSLIGKIESHLTSTDDSLRGRATQLVSDLLAANVFVLTPAKVHHLFLFFLGRIEDYPSLSPSISGFHALVTCYQNEMDAKYEDCFQSLRILFEEVNVQSIAQSNRSDIYSYITTVLGNKSLAVELKPHADNIADGALAITGGERDPRCLVKSLCLLATCMLTFPDCGKAFAEKFFDAAAGYFPIAFRPAADDRYGITTAMLVSAVENVLCCHNEVARHTVPFMVEKLGSTDVSSDGKLDALHCLIRLLKGFKTDLKSVDHSLTFDVFSASLSRLSEILVEIISSNAAGDEGENDSNPVQSKHSIVQGALDCITAVCDMLSNIQTLDPMKGNALFLKIAEPILKSCMVCMSPIQVNGVVSLQLNSLSGISSTKIMLAMSKSSYWIFSTIVIRCAAALIRDMDTSISCARSIAGSGSVTPLSSASFQFFLSLLKTLNNNINYSDIIMASDAGGSSAPQMLQKIFISVMSRIQRSLCLFEDSKCMLNSNWDLLATDDLDSWIENIPKEPEIEASSSGGCCGGSKSNDGGCCKGGNEAASGSCCSVDPVDTFGSLDSLVLSSTSTPVLSFLAAVFQCLSGVLSKCPVALFPIDCIKTACSVAVEVSTRMVISRPNTSSKDRYAPKTMTAELQVLQDASVDFLCQFCIAQRTFKDASVYQVVNEKIEHLFSIFSLCDENFSSTLKVLVALSAKERSDTRANKEMITTKRLISSLVGILSEKPHDSVLCITALTTTLELLSGREVKVLESATANEEDFEACIDALSSNYYSPLGRTAVSNNSSDPTLYWLSPASRYAILTSRGDTSSHVEVSKQSMVCVSDIISQFICEASSEDLSTLQRLSRFALSFPQHPGVGIIGEIIRITIASLPSQKSEQSLLSREHVSHAILQDIACKLIPFDGNQSLASNATSTRLATAAVTPLSHGCSAFTCDGFETNEKNTLCSNIQSILDASFSIYDLRSIEPIREDLVIKCCEVSAWYIATVLSKMPYKSSRAQELSFRILATVRRVVCNGPADTNVRSMKCGVFCAVCLLVWGARTQFMRLDTPVKLASTATSATWQQLYLNNVLSALLHGRLDEAQDSVFLTSKSHTRLPGGQSLLFAGHTASFLLPGNLNQPSVAAKEVCEQDHVDMDIIESSVEASEIAQYLKYALSLRIPVLSGNTHKSGFILTSYESDSFHSSAVWRQKLFHRMFEPLSSAVLKQSEYGVMESVDAFAMWALCGLLTGTPFSIIGSDETRLPVLKVVVCALGINRIELAPDNSIVLKAKSAALVTLEVLLAHEQPPMMFVPFLPTIIPELLKTFRASSSAASYCSSDRARSCRCLLQLLSLPYAELHPFKPQVLRGLKSALDDPKRAVRRLAVKVRNEWSVSSGVGK